MVGSDTVTSQTDAPDDYVMNETEQAALEKYYEVTGNGSTEERLDRIELAVTQLDVKLTTILEAVDSIMEQAKPAIEQLTNSPLVKMITGAK